MISKGFPINPEFDLVLERVIDVAPELVWRAWTEPEHVKKWFTPAPWKTVDCEVDLRPGGIFRTVMESPEGQRFSGSSCYLEVVPNTRLVWTNALLPGYRPSNEDPGPVSYFTAVISIEPHGTGTKYTAIAVHKDPESRAAHAQMGFYDGWGAALDQLIEVAKTLG